MAPAIATKDGMAQVKKYVISYCQRSTVLAINIATKGVLWAVYH